MKTPLSLFIGLRYTSAKRRNHFISFISGVAMLGMVVGVWALITALSIINGFHHELRERILFAVPHLTISGPEGRLSDWPQIAAEVLDHPDVRAEAPFILGPGMITHAGRVTGAVVRGIDPKREKNVSQILAHITAGDAARLIPGEFHVILGRTLARQLGVGVGDKITVVVPTARATPAGLLPRLRRFEVVALFALDMHEYDSSLALVHIDDAARLWRYGDQVSGLRLKLISANDARRVRYELGQRLPDISVSDWTLEHANFFRALEIEKRVIFIVLLLIIAVAAFNIISTLVMTVTDKQADIAILRTLGLSPAGIMRIFLVQGATIALIGSGLGGILGVLTALNADTIIPFIENLFRTELFPGDIYLISDFPAQLRGSDVVAVITCSLGLGLLAALYPSWRAARTAPADALRHP